LREMNYIIKLKNKIKILKTKIRQMKTKENLPKNAFYDLINQSFESKNQNSMNNGNKE